ncbi:DUF4893 domain-containing protein [Paracoccus bogoriensis]|uniref:DUF4893 domain-containing protein n=1 Tax=Paracoccus bogoriensis TaxID=242065 RepID=UPI001C67CEC9|nr:DUF4893 domain-containing protein [Paracoccus bogoriensis]MBW7056693.1 DUF4893 domain-containing protein [Paracoccus bogoriensis]
MKKTDLAALATAALLGALPAHAIELADLSNEIRPDDRARLELFDETAGRALMGALAAGDGGDVGVMVAGLAGEPLPPLGAALMLEGDWSCRVLKLGGGLPLVAYQPFRCRVGADGSFEKLTGSQRMRGRIGLVDGEVIYLGTAFVAGETPPDYADLPPEIDPGATPQFMPEVGRVQIVDGNAARIILPMPHLESDLNIVLLSR